MRVAGVHANRIRRRDAAAVVGVVEGNPVDHDSDGSRLNQGVNGGTSRHLGLERNHPPVILIADRIGVAALAGKVAVLVIRNTGTSDDQKLTLNSDDHIRVKIVAGRTPLAHEVADLEAVGAAVAVEVRLARTPL